MANKPVAHVNFQDWLTQNQPQVDAMGKRVQQTQDQLQGYGQQAQGELKQAAVNAGKAGTWNGDAQSLGEFGHYKDATNAYNDYQLDSGTNAGRQMQLYNQYQGQATGADAALMYRRGQHQAANNQHPQGWDNYLQGVNQVAGEAQNAFVQRQRAAEAERQRVANAIKQKEAEDAAKAAELARQKAEWDQTHDGSYGESTSNIDSATTSIMNGAPKSKPKRPY